MKKILVLLAILLILEGCVSYNPESLKKELDSVTKDFSISEKIVNNNRTKYFKYYLPSDMTQDDNGENSIVLKYNESEIVMNLNIASIISEKYFNTNVQNEGFFEEKNLYYSNNGEYNVNGKSKHYYLYIYEEDSDYLVYLVNSDVIFYGYTSLNNLKGVVEHLISISKSIDVSTNDVINDYVES